MPPASPVPGWCSGEVCTESMATRRGLRCSRSRGAADGERRPSLLTYWLTWRSSLLRACQTEGCLALQALQQRTGAQPFPGHTPLRNHYSRSSDDSTALTMPSSTLDLARHDLARRPDRPVSPPAYPRG